MYEYNNVYFNNNNNKSNYFKATKLINPELF